MKLTLDPSMVPTLAILSVGAALRCSVSAHGSGGGAAAGAEPPEYETPLVKMVSEDVLSALSDSRRPKRDAGLGEEERGFGVACALGALFRVW